MQAALARSQARDPSDPRILGDLYGRVLLTRSIVADDLAALPGLFEQMMDHVRVASSGTSVFPGLLFWAILHAIDDDDLGVAVQAEFIELNERFGLPLFAHEVDAVEAVVHGRAGRAGAATALMNRARVAHRRLLPLGAGLWHTHQLLVAGPALRDGWGEPVVWLREAEAFFAAGGFDRIARRCRIVLGEAGAPMPRRGRGSSPVPASLRAMGVTSREVDVLRLVVAGISTREIGERLHPSPRTVERHLGNLFHRTGVGDRDALRTLARDHDLQTG